nr:GTP-binding protein [Anaerolineae bacterium]
MSLPTSLKDTRKLINTFDLRSLEAAIAREIRARLVIIGPVNSGKSTLFNKLKGSKVSPVSAVPGTTTETIAEQFGPFTLVDTPGLGEVAGQERSLIAFSALNDADVVVLVLDAAAGIRQENADLYQRLRAMGLTVVIALNKMDLIRADLEAVIRDAERKMQAPVIPISAKRGTNIARQLIPTIIDSHPQMAVTIGRSLPQFRKLAAGRVIREAAALAALVGAEPVPAVEIPLLVATQVRMLLRLAAIYGEDMTVARARELIGAIAGGVAIRYGAQEVVKLVPGPGWLVAAFVAGTGTVALGNAAVAFFQYQLSPPDLRRLYRSIRWKRSDRNSHHINE